MQIVLLSTDLMLVAAAHGAASRHDAKLVVASNCRDALTACADAATRLLAIDLRTPGIDIGAFMTDLRAAAAAPIHVIASAPHVHEASLEQAKRAGCDEVVSRGEVERRLAATLERLSVSS